MEIETREVSVLRKFLHIDGEEFPAAAFLTILEDLEGTALYGRMLAGPSGVDQEIFDYLEDRGITGRNIQGAYYCKDEDSREELLDQILEIYYDD